MEKSENFGFNLPSRDSDDIVDISQISDNFRIIDKELNEIDNISATVKKIDDKSIITITDKNGTVHTAEVLDGQKGDKGDKGDKGQDYVLTDADKKEIAQSIPAVLYTEQTLTEEQKAQARKNIGAADNETVMLISAKTSGYRTEGINLVFLDEASPKGEWWYNGKKYTSGNANTDASCSFKVAVEPNITYYTQMYDATSKSKIGAVAGYLSWFDVNGTFISQANSNMLGVQTSPENANYAMVTFRIYETKEDTEVSRLPYMGSVVAPNEYPPNSEEITFKTLQADINELKACEKETEDTSKPLLHLPAKYDLVVGDTFELFYYGITNCSSWEGFYIKAVGGKGNCYRNRFVYTPVAADVGTHTITFTLYDNQMNQIDETSVNLVVHTKIISLASEKVILCVGDSLFGGGTIPDELHRRLCGTDGTPVGDGLTNIKFIGTQRSNRNNVPYEGYGGWTFGSYNTEFKQKSFVWVTADNHGKTTNDQHSIYKDSTGNEWKLETIESNRIKIIGANVTQGLPATSGTLTWVSGGDNHTDITFTTAEIASGNPFWNESANSVDFANYARSQGVDTIDYVYVLLGWNNVGASVETYKPTVTTFINNVRLSFPNCKIVLFGLQKPSIDGIGANYGTNATYNYPKMQDHVWLVDEVYENVASETSNVSFVNVSGQFDTTNNMPEYTRTVNTRNSKTETYQSNGLHPAQSGSFQIADAMYRKFTADN